MSKSTTGFAMLFAVLASSLLMAIGISMFNISIKEIQIATSERDSQVAYYAADSARECAIYSDIAKGLFPICDSPTCPSTPPPTAVITCNGTDTTLAFNKTGSYTYTFNSPRFFKYSTTTPPNLIEPEGGASVKKEFDPNTGIVTNTITAIGHNTGVPGRRVERSIGGQY